MHRKIIVFFALSMVVIACVSEVEKQRITIEKKAEAIVEQALKGIEDVAVKDSLLKVFNATLADSAQLGLEFAIQIKNIAAKGESGIKTLIIQQESKQVQKIANQALQEVDTDTAATDAQKATKLQEASDDALKDLEKMLE